VKSCVPASSCGAPGGRRRGFIYYQCTKRLQLVRGSFDSSTVLPRWCTGNLEKVARKTQPCPSCPVGEMPKHSAEARVLTRMTTQNISFVKFPARF